MEEHTSTPTRRHLTRARGRGAKSLLTPEKARVIVRAVRKGATIAQAAQVADIGVRTLYRWLARGHDAGVGLEYALLLGIQEAAASYDTLQTRQAKIANLDELLGVS